MRRVLGSVCLVAGLAGLAALAGCPAPGADDEIDAAPPKPDAYVGPSTALFSLPRGPGQPAEYYELPFPNDLRVRAGGTLDLDDHARPNDLLEIYLGLMSTEFIGFGPNQASFVRFTAPIDEASLPATPEASLDEGAAVYLVDVDPDSPDRGKRVPLRFTFEHDEGETIGPDSLRCLPFPGFTLRTSTTYALVVTSRLRAPDGTPIGRSADAEALFGGGGGGDPVVASAAEVYAPLFAWLDEPGGDERADVVAATVYTTGDPTALVGRARAVVYADAPAPELAELTLVKAAADLTVYEARIGLPSFQTGVPPYLEDGGRIELDGAGDPIIQRTETVRVAMSFPPGEVPPGGWPLVIYAHGTGGTYMSFVNDGTAKRFAAAGFAVLGIDQVMNGTRYDGGATPDDGAVEVAFYNFNNPIAGRDNSRQNAIDHFSLVRLAEAAVVDERHPGGRVHHYDADRLYFMGHSQGGIIGPLFVAWEPKIRGAVFSGAGGLLYFALLLKTEPISIPDLLMAFLRDNPLDEFNNMLALVQMFIEPADPINYARLIAAEPPPGVPGKDVFQSQGITDHFTPVPAIGALGVALGGSLVGPVIVDEPGFALAGRPVLEAPVTKNLGEHTVVLRQYAAPAGSDGHFVVFDVPDAQRQSVEFLRTLDQDGVATLVQ
jgi:hypothetical protein